MAQDDKPWTSIVEEHLTNEQRQTLALHRIEGLLTQIRDSLAVTNSPTQQTQYKGKPSR